MTARCGAAVPFLVWRAALPALFCACVVTAWGAAYGDQAFVVTALGNVFAVEEPEAFPADNQTMSLAPRLVPRLYEGFFIIGQARNADAVSFQATYAIPAAVWADASSVYAAVGSSPTQSAIMNNGNYIYQNGLLYQSTFGLPHALHQLYGKTYEGALSYHVGSNYITFAGNGTAAYSLAYVYQGGIAVKDFLIERVCHSVPCGNVTVARAQKSLLLHNGPLEGAGLYDVMRLEGGPVRATSSHYVIVDTSPGGVRLKVSAYDPDTLHIRNVPRGTAYLIGPVAPSAPDPGAPSHLPHRCCDAPHYTIPAYRAGVQTGGAISYGSDSLAESAGARGMVNVKMYQDALWHAGPAAGTWLVFDHVNGRIIRAAGAPATVQIAHHYVMVPSAGNSTIQDVSLNRSGCVAPDVSLPYMQGNIKAGRSIHVPIIVGHPVLCITVGSIQHTMPYHAIQEASQAASFQPISYDAAQGGAPRTIPCASCGHGMLQTDMEGVWRSSAVILAGRDGPIDLALSGQGRYHGAIHREWDSLQGTGDISHWQPQVAIRDAGGAHIMWYRNGILQHTDQVRCQQESHISEGRRTTTQSGITVHHWHYNYTHGCDSDILIRRSMAASAGDVIEAVLEITPDIVLRTKDLNASGSSDRIHQQAYGGGIIVKSYR